MAGQPAEPPAGEEDGAGWYVAQVGGDFLLYLLLNAVTAVGGFLILPVLLHTLDRPDLGRFALVEGCLAVTLSLSLAGQKFAYLQMDRRPRTGRAWPAARHGAALAARRPWQATRAGRRLYALCTLY